MSRPSINGMGGGPSSPVQALGAHDAVSGTSAAPLQAKEEHGTTVHLSPSNSNNMGSVSSLEDVDMKDNGRMAAPKLPHIPMQPMLLSGVVVEHWPDCMHVQAKRRDRKGLPMDSTNAMKTLHLEVRTAAMTTTQEGLVLDVFDVCVDDQELQPADIQNLVPEALLQPYVGPSDKHKHVRC